MALKKSEDRLGQNRKMLHWWMVWKIEDQKVVMTNFAVFDVAFKRRQDIDRISLTVFRLECSHNNDVNIG